MTDFKENVESFAERLIKLVLPSFRSHFSLAGGVFKSLHSKKKIRDLDLWPHSEADRKLLITELIANGAEIEQETLFNTLLKLKIEGCDTAIDLFGNAPIIKIEVTKKCRSTLKECLEDFDLVLSCVGVEFADNKLIGSFVNDLVFEDITERQISLIPDWKMHKYNLISLSRLIKYSKELDYSVAESARERICNRFSNADVYEREELLKNAEISHEEFQMLLKKCRIYSDNSQGSTVRNS